MKIPSGNGIPPMIGPASAPQARPVSPSPAQKDPAQHFDQVTISAPESDASLFQMELKSRLSQEVRTVTTTGKLAELRNQVKAGEYQPDPVAIARKMLLIED